MTPRKRRPVASDMKPHASIPQPRSTACAPIRCVDIHTPMEPPQPRRVARHREEERRPGRQPRGVLAPNRRPAITGTACDVGPHYVDSVELRHDAPVQPPPVLVVLVDDRDGVETRIPSVAVVSVRLLPDLRDVRCRHIFDPERIDDTRSRPIPSRVVSHQQLQRGPRQVGRDAVNKFNRTHTSDCFVGPPWAGRDTWPRKCPCETGQYKVSHRKRGHRGIRFHNGSTAPIDVVLAISITVSHQSHSES